MEGVSQEMVDREIADVHAEKPVAEKTRKPGRPRNGAKAEGKAKTAGKPEKILVVLNADQTYREISAEDLDQEITDAIKEPTRRIVQGVIGVVGRPQIVFGQK